MERKIEMGGGGIIINSKSGKNMYICNVHNWQLQQRVLTGLPYSGWQKRHFNNYSKRERKTSVETTDGLQLNYLSQSILV